MNILNAKIIVKKAIASRLTPMMWGKHGIGKSQVVQQIAEDIAKDEKLTFTNDVSSFDNKHFGFVDLRLGQMEVGDLIGMPFGLAEKQQTIWFKPQWFPIAADSKGIIFLDELNRARLDVLQAVFQLVWDRRINTHRLPQGWGIVVACNPAGSEYFVNELDAALMDRFVHIKLTPETKEWVEWAKNKGEITADITDFVEKYPEMLGNEGCEVPIDVKPSPRSWQVLSVMLKGLDEELWLETTMGIIGNEAAIPFIESLKRNLERPIRADQVLNHYDKWKSKIKKYGSTEKSRFDLLRISCDDIERILKKDFSENDKNINKEQEKNLVDFLRDLPSDLAFAMIKTLVDNRRMGTDKYNQMLCKYNDLYMKLEKVSKLDEE
jgi:hypothetical protein